MSDCIFTNIITITIIVVFIIAIILELKKRQDEKWSKEATV